MCSSRHCAQFLQVFNQHIHPDIVLSSYKSSTNISIQTLCSVPTSLQPTYPSRHCAQFLQVFNQHIHPDIVLRQDVIYKSSNKSFLPMRTKSNAQSKDRLKEKMEFRGSIPDKETRFRTSVQ